MNYYLFWNHIRGEQIRAMWAAERANREFTKISIIAGSIYTVNHKGQAFRVGK